MTFLRTLSATTPASDLRPIGQIEREIVDELDCHIAMRTDENIRLGMPPDAAHLAASTQFGDYAKIQQKCRRTLLGERIMWQRMQTALSIVLLMAVALLAAQLYSAQKANRAALADITTTLKQLAQPPSDKNAASGLAFPNNWIADRPMVVQTVPKSGDMEVDPSLNEIRATFSKTMADRSWSWVHTSKGSFPEQTGEIHYLDDNKTCAMPVKLEPGKKYVIWFNSANYHNFKDSDGRPAEPYLLTFTTRKLSDDATKKN